MDQLVAAAYIQPESTYNWAHRIIYYFITSYYKLVYVLYYEG